MSIIFSISGLFKTILIIIGAFIALRFIGQLMNAKRNMNEEQALKDRLAREEKERQFVEKNQGKIHITKGASNRTEDVDFEEVK